MLPRLLISCILLLGSCNSAAQAEPVDSLLQLLGRARTDTTRLQLLVHLSEISETRYILKYAGQALRLADKLLPGVPEGAARKQMLIYKADALNNIGYELNNEGKAKEALECYRRSLLIREEIADSGGIANSLNNMGFVYDHQGQIREALDCYTRSLELRTRLGQMEAMARTINNMAVIYYKLGDIPEALRYYGQSLNLREKVNDKVGVARSLNNIAVVYKNQNDLEAALSYYQRSEKIQEEIQDKYGLSYTLHNIGVLYYNQGRKDTAMAYYLRSLALRKELGDKQGLALSYHSLALIYTDRRELGKSLYYNLLALDLRKELGEKEGLTNSYNSSANTFRWQGRYQQARVYADSALQIARGLGFPENIRNAELTLVRVDSALGNFIGALAHYQQYILFTDSLNNETTRKASTRSQLKYEFEKKEAVIREQQKKERALDRETARVQRMVMVSAGLGLLLLAGFALYVFRSLKVVRVQKKVIEEKQREIVDSIRYASRIQRALIPREGIVYKLLSRAKLK